MVASRAGGIQDQIVDAAAIAATAREWVLDRFLGSRHLVQYLRLLDGLLNGERR